MTTVILSQNATFALGSCANYGKLLPATLQRIRTPKAMPLKCGGRHIYPRISAAKDRQELWPYLLERVRVFRLAFVAHAMLR